MRNLLVTLAVSSVTALALAQAPAAGTPTLPEQPKAIPGFDLSALDRSTGACTDFYQFACGGWLKANPIPSDQPAWGRFNELAERNRAVLRDILESFRAPRPERTPQQARLGDAYAACMDEKVLNTRKGKALDAAVKRIWGLKDKKAFTGLLAYLHSLGVNALFESGSEQDAKDATKVIAVVDQGGLGLPDRDYYLKEDPKSVETRERYQQHVQAMFTLFGDPARIAVREGRAVLEFETELAKASQDKVTRRDPTKLYNPRTLAQLQAQVPTVDWAAYFRVLGAPEFTELNVRSPEFFQRVAVALDKTSLDTWKVYLKWALLRSSAHLLSDDLVNEDFEFHGKYLLGQQQLKPRWKRCVAQVDNDLGEALGQEYVARTFGEAGKARTLEMVKALELAVAADIKELPWMTAETKQRAQEKLAAIANKIGYPEKWRDYSALTVRREDALGNAQRAAAFEARRQLEKIGKPVDKLEWFMTPPTVNAYYDPQMNNINFPAGILQPPFYDNALDDAVNYGAIGAVIGHELTHGFDDEGRQFDAAGNLKDWWTPEDAKAFEEKAKCFVDQYAAYVAVSDPPNDVHLNGALTLGENTADNGGLRVALRAFKDVQGGKEPPARDGFSAEQRFFLGWGQVWCTNTSDAYARLVAQTNPHSLPRFRVNGVVANMPEFAKAYGCKAGDPMVRPQPCRVW